MVENRSLYRRAWELLPEKVNKVFRESEGGGQFPDIDTPTGYATGDWVADKIAQLMQESLVEAQQLGEVVYDTNEAPFNEEATEKDQGFTEKEMSELPPPLPPDVDIPV